MRRDMMLVLCMVPALTGVQCDCLIPLVDFAQDNVRPDVVALGPTAVNEGERAYLTCELVGNIRGPGEDAPVYAWSQVEGTPVAIQNADTAEQAWFEAPYVDGDARIAVRLTVTTTNGPLVSDVLVIAVRDTAIAQRPPVAVAGPDQQVPPGTRVTLDASRSYDLDGTALSYAWEQIDGPAVTLEHADRSAAIFTAPAADQDRELVFRVTVRDETGSADEAQTVVRVVP